MSTDLALQIGGLIGASLLLYLVTTPRKDLLDQEEGPLALRGVRKYSSYHRIRYYHSISSSSASSSQ
jgi:hypothetical protein